MKIWIKDKEGKEAIIEPKEGGFGTVNIGVAVVPKSEAVTWLENFGLEAEEVV